MLSIFLYYTTFSRVCKANYTLFLAFSVRACYNIAMENKEKQNQTVIKIKFSKKILILSALVYILCAVGTAVSIWRVCRYGIHGFSDVLKYPFLIAVCVFCVTLVTSVLIKSQYVIKDGNLITQYGFIKSKFPAKDFTSMTLNTDEKKLTIYSGEQYMIISVSPTWVHEFTKALLDINPKIEYTFTLTDKAE